MGIEYYRRVRDYIPNGQSVPSAVFVHCRRGPVTQTYTKTVMFLVGSPLRLSIEPDKVKRARVFELPRAPVFHKTDDSSLQLATCCSPYASAQAPSKARAPALTRKDNAEGEPELGDPRRGLLTRDLLTVCELSGSWIGNSFRQRLPSESVEDLQKVEDSFRATQPEVYLSPKAPTNSGNKRGPEGAKTSELAPAGRVRSGREYISYCNI